MLKKITFFVIASMLILTACGNRPAANPQEESQGENGEQKSSPNEEIPTQGMLFPVGGHEQARDIVVAHVAELTGLPVPVGEWVFQDQTQQNSDNGLTWLFMNGPWVVQVSAPAIAPEPVVYSVTIDHMSAVIRWEGTIDSFGNIAETDYVQGLQPESPEKPGEPSWVGVVVSNSPGSQFDDYFQLMDQNGTRYGVEGVDEAIKSQLVSYRDTGIIIQVWGILHKDVSDAYGAQILVTRIESY